MFWEKDREIERLKDELSWLKCSTRLDEEIKTKQSKYIEELEKKLKIYEEIIDKFAKKQD